MIVPSQIENLFKSIAQTHPSILHEDVEGKIAFGTDQISDIIDGVFKAFLKPEGFSLRYISPVFNSFTDETSGMLSNIQTGFAILKRCDHTNLTDIKNVKDDAFSIVRDIIARLVFMSRNGNDILYGSFNQLTEGQMSIEEVQFQGDGTWAGQLCLISFKSEFIDDIDSAVNAVQWTDL